MTINWDVIRRHKSERDFQLETHVSLKHDYVYLQVCKAGSSTLRYHLQKVEYQGSGYKVQDVNNKHLSPHVWPFQLKDEVMFGLLSDQQSKRFAFVRNPFSRLLSAYLQRVAIPSPSRKRLVSNLGLKDGDPISFASFVTFVCSQLEPADMDSHWRPQINAVMHPEVTLHFVGRVETMAADLLTLSDVLFGSQRFDRQEIDSIHLAPVRTDAHKSVASCYTSPLAELVRERYTGDFETFGYPRDLPR